MKKKNTFYNMLLHEQNHNPSIAGRGVYVIIRPPQVLHNDNDIFFYHVQVFEVDSLRSDLGTTCMQKTFL